jgi:hypothetical protein
VHAFSTPLSGGATSQGCGQFVPFLSYFLDIYHARRVLGSSGIGARFLFDLPFRTTGAVGCCIGGVHWLDWGLGLAHR